MSRKKDINSIAPLVTKLRGVDEPEARRQLAKDSARKLRWRRKMVESARRPLDVGLMRDWSEINKRAGQLLAEMRVRNFPAHETVQ